MAKAGVRYHISEKTERPNICRAETPASCTVKKTPHFTTKEEARAFVEKTHAHEQIATLKKKGRPKKATQEPRRGAAKKEAPDQRPAPSEARRAPSPSPAPVESEVDLLKVKDRLEALEAKVYAEAPEEELEVIEDEASPEEEADDLYEDHDEDATADACEDCGAASYRWRTDPYILQAHGEEERRRLCDDCYENLASF